MGNELIKKIREVGIRADSSLSTLRRLILTKQKENLIKTVCERRLIRMIYETEAIVELLKGIGDENTKNAR